MLAKRDWLASFVIPCLVVLLISARISHAQVSYTTTSVGNTYSTTPTYVGNAMRSMWVAPEGVIYTSSMWDESQGSINIYQNGQKSGSFGAHGETQGGAISGDATDLFAALQFNTTLGGSGYVGRYNRSTKTRDLTWSASSDTTERRADVITGIADTGTLVYVSDHPDNLVRCYTTAGVWQSDWTLTDPGAIAVDGSGNIWVAQMNEGTIQEFARSGNMLNTITMGSSARPSAMYYDSANNQLMIGDQGPNMNIQIYGNLSSTPTLVGSFGVQDGYLDTTSGSKGQTGSQRFTRIVGIGKDSSGNLYVLNNPWGGTWDLGRNGKTDLHAYNSSGVLQYTLQALNFEGNAAFDPGTDGANLYGGQDVFTGTGGGGYVGNSVDALDYPTDPRVDVTSQSRGFDFGLMTSVNGHRILAAAGQNSDAFLFSYFPTNQYVSVPFGSLPGQASAAGYNYSNYFNTTARIRNGFCLDMNGDIWVGLDKTNAITHYALTGFDANGLPVYGTPTTTPTPSTIAPLGGIEYIPSTDTMVLMNANGTDWTSLGGRVEVYHGWKAGNTTNPDLVINLKTAQNPKGRAAAGNYLFISYVHTVPDIDAYNLMTGANDLTMTSADPSVAVGNDVDSMYGIRAYQTSTGDYLISKDNYNNNSIVIHRMTVVPKPDFTVSATPSSQTVTQGSSTTYTAAIGALNGFTDTVNLSVTDLPTGATASFSPASITTSGSSTLTVSTATTTPAGTYTLTIRGATSTLRRTATVTLVVSGPPDFTTSASPSSQTVTQGNGTSYTASISPLSGFNSTVNLSVSGLPTGATAAFNPMSVSGSGNSALKVSTSTTTPTGTYTLTITGTDGSLSHSATVTLVVAAPDFSISATPSSQTAAPGNSATYTTTIGTLNGFTDTVNLNVTGLPSGATASFSPASVTTSGSSTLTVSTAATTPTGTYTLTITGTDGSLSHSATVNLAVTTNAGGLPTGWTDLDVGGVSLAGSASYNNGTFTVNGAGTSISGTADQFNYAYQAAAGTNYTITARVVSLTNTNSGAQAGVMVRETLDAGSTMANINVTPSNGVTWVYRSTTGGATSGSRTAGLVTPYWVRVVRSGSTLTGYRSPDGVTWTQQGTVTISMASNVYIGLVVSSRNNSELATATFDNVSVTTPNTQSLTISPQSARTTYGNATTALTATATFTGSTSPTGSLVFQVGSGNQIPGSCSVNSNTFSCTANYPTSELAAGSYTINVLYAGDSTFAQSSASSSMTINQAAANVIATAATCTYNASGCSGGGSATGVNGEALTPATLSYRGTGNTAYGPTATPPVFVGTYAVTASFAGNNNYTSGTSIPAPISVTPAPTMLSSFAVSPNTQQYSDSINISAAPVSAPSISGNVSFFINYGTATQQQLGATQAVGPNGTATVSNVVLLESAAGSIAPGTHNVTAIFTPTDLIDFTASVNTVALTIAKEDANLTYTGQYVLYTSSPSTYSVTAPLTFTVQDSNAVPNTSLIYDLNPGDIRNARFKILVDGVATPGCSNLQPSLVTADTRVGTIGCTYTFSFSSGQTGITPTITVVPDTNSYYAATAGDSDFAISVNLPSQTNFITGGGYLVNNASAGTYAGDAGLNTNFGFNVKYNKGGTNLQGNVNIVVRNNGRLYQIKSTSISSLGVTDTAQGGYGSFIAKANIQDVTDPLNPISIEGDDSLTISFHDNGTPGTNDIIAISVYKGGILRFASDWNGTATVEQSLAGGDLAAH